MQVILETLLIFLPILAANQGPSWKKALAWWFDDRPVSVRWLGKGKTWGAYFTGPVASLGTVLILYALPPTSAFADQVFGLELPAGRRLVVVGVSLGLGAILGDHIKSFIKQRVGRESGTKWWPDRIDFAVGGSIAAWLVLPSFKWEHFLLILGMAWPIHYVGNKVSYYFNWRDTPH